MAIHDYPLIAVTEVFDMPSVDNNTGSFYGPVELGPTIDILERKLRDVTGDYALRDKSEPLNDDSGYGWGRDTEIENPIHIVIYEGSHTDVYGLTLDSSWVGRKIMGNGHHRLAYQAFIQGALFVHYGHEKSDSGW
jgi:hypothetical protein